MGHLAERSPAARAASRKLDEEIEHVIAGGASRYPNGSVFVPADADWAGAAIARHAREGRTIVLVAADGRDSIFHSRRPWTLSGIRGRLKHIERRRKDKQFMGRL